MHTSSRRHFLATLSGSLAASTLPTFGADQPDLKTISIINTTDLHGHILPTKTYEGIGDVGGLARCSTLIRQWRTQNPDNLLVDAGDLYQGTHLSRRNEGALMVKLLNKLNYDAWVLGNHDFDWGIEPAQAAVRDSKMPVLAANLNIDGKLAGSLAADSHPFSKIAPYKIFTVAGFRIGVLGLTTPGLPFWLRPEMISGIEPLDPSVTAKNTIAAMQAEGVDAIVAVGHMGSKFGKDDFANRVNEILKDNRDIDVYIAGHTHQDMANYSISGALYTQASYYGIHLGRIDLTFSRESRKLVHKRAHTIFMDNRFEPDPFVLAVARDQIDITEEELSKPVCTVTAPLSAKFTPGVPNDQEKLIAAAIRHALDQKKVNVDAVLHGAFLETEIPAGKKTMADLWDIIPYENMIVTASLTGAQIVTMLEEIFNSGRYAARNLVGVQVTMEKVDKIWKVRQLTHPANAQPIGADERLTIALNSYDAQSGGKRFMATRDIINASESKSAFHLIETRDALAHYLLATGTIDPAKI
jgi:2',3'-cyclic-nucleotide 2'-phosphodiesterase (5'-nucleotidase family)